MEFIDSAYFMYGSGLVFELDGGLANYVAMVFQGSLQIIHIAINVGVNLTHETKEKTITWENE